MYLVRAREDRAKKLTGKVALISGSGRGIGRAIALKLASEGARIVINDLDEAPAQEVADEIIKVTAAKPSFALEASPQLILASVSSRRQLIIFTASTSSSTTRATPGTT